MGLTERHWFENEDVPENYEWALEDAVYNSCTNKKADTVEVVRCKDCKHYDGDENSGIGTCFENGVCSTTEWFCADGERRTSNA